jgi:single-strand DNA-binding protein
MARLNRFEFIGNLTRDAELRNTGTGRAVATIHIAVDDSWKDGEGTTHEQTEYFRISAWDKLGEAAHKYLGKGSGVWITGKVKNTEYMKDGQKVYGTDFVADDIQYFNTKQPQHASDEAA